MSHKNTGPKRLALPSVGGIWEKGEERFEVAISQYDANGVPQVKFLPLPSEWIPWDLLHQDYRYLGKVKEDK